MTDPVRTRARARETAALARAGVHSNFPGNAEPWVRWAVAADLAPGLAALHLLAFDLRPRFPARCRASDWTAMLDLVLDLDLPAWAHDTAVDLLHDAASMPCRCLDCAPGSAEKAIIAERTSRREGSVFDAGRYTVRRG